MYIFFSKLNKIIVIIKKSSLLLLLSLSLSLSLLLLLLATSCKLHEWFKDLFCQITLQLQIRNLSLVIALRSSAIKLSIKKPRHAPVIYHVPDLNEKFPPPLWTKHWTEKTVTSLILQKSKHTLKWCLSSQSVVSRSLHFLYFFQNSQLRHCIGLKSRPLNWPMKILVLLYKISRHLENNINEHRWKKMGKFWQVDYPRLAGDELRRNHNPKCWWKKVGVYIILFFFLMLLWMDMLGKLCAPLPQLSALQRCRMIQNVVEICYMYC